MTGACGEGGLGMANRVTFVTLLKVRLVVAMSIVAVWGEARAQSGRLDETDEPARVRRIAELIVALGDESYDARTRALQDLIEIGPDVLPPLREAARSDDAEVALRARHAVEKFGRVLLAGAEIELSAEPAAVQWNEPFALRVRITNHSAQPCQTPFAPDLSKGVAADRDDLQVAAMLDLADFLRVVGPDGRTIQFYCEPIEEDERIERIVRARAERAPFTALGGGMTQIIELPGFNRGWARYRMLAAGEYTIRFLYQPDWRDAELARRQVGRVSSGPAKVVVRTAADRVIRESERRVMGRVVRRGGEWVAVLQNVHDRRTYVNTNWGDDILRRARLTWLIPLERGGIAKVVHRSGRNPFLRERVVGMDALERVEIARIGRDAVVEAIGADSKPAAGLDPGFTYVNVLSRGSLIRGRATAEDWDDEARRFYEQLPRLIHTGRVSVDPS